MTKRYRYPAWDMTVGNMLLRCLPEQDSFRTVMHVGVSHRTNGGGRSVMLDVSDVARTVRFLAHCYGAVSLPAYRATEGYHPAEKGTVMQCGLPQREDTLVLTLLPNGQLHVGVHHRTGRVVLSRALTCSSLGGMDLRDYLARWHMHVTGVDPDAAVPPATVDVPLPEIGQE